MGWLQRVVEGGLSGGVGLFSYGAAFGGVFAFEVAVAEGHPGVSGEAGLVDPVLGEVADLPVIDGMRIRPHFVERPGLAELDLLADLQDFLVEIGEYGPGDSIYDLDVDWGEYGYDPGIVIRFEPDGIPDVAEFALLESVLKDIHLNNTSRGGIAHIHSWQDFYHNQLQAAVDLFGESAAAINTVAAYMTLGSYGHRMRIIAAVEAHYAVTMNTNHYHNAASVPFYPDRDLDNDGDSNLREWSLTPAVAAGGLSPNASRVRQYALNARDKAWPGDDPPPEPPGGAKAAPGHQKSEGEGEACPNADCIPEVTVTLEDSEHVTIRGEFQGEPLAPGEPVDVPVGSEISVEVTGGDEYFKTWSAPGTLGNDSWRPTEKFVVTDDITVKPLEKAEVTLQVRYNDGPPVDYGDPVLEGEVVSLSSPGDFTIPGHGPGLVEGYHASSSARTVAGYVYQPITLRTPAASFSAVRGHRLEAEGGGVVLGAIGDGTPGHDSHVFLGTVYGRETLPPHCGAAHTLTAKGFPEPGYFITQPERGVAVDLCGGDATVTLLFRRKYELELVVEVEGEGSPGCAGYISAESIAKRGYAPGEEVKLYATALPGYKFIGWRGDGKAWVQEDEPGGPYAGNPDPLGQIEDDTIFLKMGEGYEPPQVRNVTAVFACECEPVTEGIEVHYVQPFIWDGQGYQGDVFHQELTADAPAGWNWEGVVVGERLCHISNDFNLTCEEIEHLETARIVGFQVLQGTALFPRAGYPPENPIGKSGLWIVGLDNAHADQHMLGVGGGSAIAYSSIIEYFDIAGPGATGSVRYKQSYYIIDPGANTMEFGRPYIAEVVLEAKFEKFDEEHSTYDENSSFPVHQLVKKGGAHNPVAWGGVPAWFVDDRWDGLSNLYKGYGLGAHNDDELCEWGSCHPIVFEKFGAVVIPE